MHLFTSMLLLWYCDFRSIMNAVLASMRLHIKYKYNLHKYIIRQYRCIKCIYIIILQKMLHILYDKASCWKKIYKKINLFIMVFRWGHSRSRASPFHLKIKTRGFHIKTPNVSEI